MIERGKINYSEKLDALVVAFSKKPWSGCPDVAGSTMYGDHDTNGAIENGFELAMRCPLDTMVFSGYSEASGVRWYVYAKDENDALRVWKKAVKEAKITVSKS